MTLGIKIKRPADLSIVERLGGFLWCKGKAFIWIVQGLWKKCAELEVIFNSCWVLEIQNEVSANQRGSSTNHIGRFGGLDVISGIIGDRYLNHLYTIEKWHVQQESIQIAESITLY